MAWGKRLLRGSVAGVAFIGMIIVSPGMVQGQGAIPPISEAKPATGLETSLIPSISVAERYDSNVFFVSGGNLEDYVTTVSPQLRVNHKRPLLEGTMGGGFTSEVYVKNPGLNYVAANGLIDLNLDGAMSEIVRGLGLHISDTFYYTPQPPSFAAPTGGGQIPESFVRGIQAQRRNSFSNTGLVAATYNASPTLTFSSTYQDQRIRFGNQSFDAVQVSPASFIDTTFQTVTSGPAFKVSPIDTVSLSHQYQKGEFSIGESSSGFSTQGALLGWIRLITPSLTAKINAGMSVFSQTNNVQYLGNGSLEWKLQDADANVSYSRVIAPSFFIAGVPLLSQVWSATVAHRVTEMFSISLNGNYAINESVPDSSLLKFKSYSVMPTIEYKVSRVMTATLSFTHSVFEQTFFSQSFSFDRNVVMLRLVAEWK